MLLAIPLLLATPVLAASLGISPSHTELEVPGNGSSTANFQVHYFSGDLEISLVDIPLRVEPETIHIESSSEPVDIQITIYGDESLGSQLYDGYVRFLGMSGGTVAVAIKVRAEVTNRVEGSPLPQKIEEVPPAQEAASFLEEDRVWYTILVAIIIALVVVLGLILARRRRS